MDGLYVKIPTQFFVENEWSLEGLKQALKICGFSHWYTVAGSEAWVRADDKALRELSLDWVAIGADCDDNVASIASIILETMNLFPDLDESLAETAQSILASLDWSENPDWYGESGAIYCPDGSDVLLFADGSVLSLYEGRWTLN